MKNTWTATFTESQPRVRKLKSRSPARQRGLLLSQSASVKLRPLKPCVRAAATFLVGLTTAATAQVHTAWVARDGVLPSGTNYQISLALDANGNAHVSAPVAQSGNANAALFKYNSAGSLVWSNYETRLFHPAVLKVDANGVTTVAGTRSTA